MSVTVACEPVSWAGAAEPWRRQLPEAFEDEFWFAAAFACVQACGEPTFAYLECGCFAGWGCRCPFSLAPRPAQAEAGPCCGGTANAEPVVPVSPEQAAEWLSPEEAATVLFQYLEWRQAGGQQVSDEAFWQVVARARDPLSVDGEVIDVPARRLVIGSANVLTFRPAEEDAFADDTEW